MKWSGHAILSNYLFRRILELLLQFHRKCNILYTRTLIFIMNSQFDEENLDLYFSKFVNYKKNPFSDDECHVYHAKCISQRLIPVNLTSSDPQVLLFPHNICRLRLRSFFFGYFEPIISHQIHVDSTPSQSEFFSYIESLVISFITFQIILLE